MKGEVADDAATLETMSKDTSLFQVMPQLVVYPKNAADVQEIVKTVRAARGASGANVCLAGRSAGTDMSGGLLTTGVVVNFMKHMNRVVQV